MKTRDLTIQDCMKNAWQALLNGDTKGRDEWCAMAEKGFPDQVQSMPLDAPIPLNMKDVTPNHNN